ncbi:MAG: S26 family signal peptidase [bacterium]|nr:S26 family signal peptidase [bacterium]
MQIEIKGKSMVPTINHGDQVEVRACGVEELRKGDVIAFWRNSSLFVHRLYGSKNGMFLTKGDRCRNFDPPVEKERVFGRVDRVTRVTDKNQDLFKISAGMKAIVLSKIYRVMAETRVRLEA